MPNDTSSPAARDLHLRHTATNGTSYVQCHRVWDADRFLLARQGEAHKANAEAKGDAPRLAKVELITRETYQQSRAPK